jgi:hypothetical protein
MTQEYEGHLPIKLSEGETACNATDFRATQVLGDDIANLLLCPMVLSPLLKSSSQYHYF